MDRLQTNPAMVAATAQAIRKASQGIDDALNELVEASTLLRAQWNGAARDAFDDAQTGFSVSMNARSELVTAIACALDDLAAGYSDTDLAGQRALGAA